jgi:DNA-binding NarL/FixJ family response regulator
MSTPCIAADAEIPLTQREAEVRLTQREAEVLRQVAGGLTNKQIAETLHIGYETVRKYVQNILQKLGVPDRKQAALWAVRNGSIGGVLFAADHENGARGL